MVLGLGPEVELVAAALRAAGESPRVLRADAGGDDEALAWAGGCWADADGPAGGLWADLRGGGSRPPPRVGLVLHGEVHALPLSALAAARALGKAGGGRPLRALGRAKAWNALADIVGGGQEERSYPDWVVRRLGQPLLELVYGPYAFTRWGVPASGLGAAVAQRHHGGSAASGDPLLRPPAGDAVAGRLRAGGARVERVQVRALRVEGGAVRGVQLAGGEVPVSGRLWVVADPATVGRWLGGADPVEAHLPSASLQAADGWRVFTPGGALPHGLDELHCPGGPAWRVQAVEGGLLWDLTAPLGAAPADPRAAVADQARALGLEPPGSGARVCLLPQHQPVWSPGCHARLRRVALARAALGVVGVGRAGLFAPLDPPAVAAHAAALTEVPNDAAWELGRERSGLGVGDSELHASFRAFIRP